MGGWDDLRVPLTLRVCDLFDFQVLRNNQTYNEDLPGK